MNKKLFITMFVAIFLLASIGFVSASYASDDISVSMVWDDNGNSVDRPNEVTVNLIEDGKVVDTATLSKSNSWKTTFKNQDSDGHYSIKVSSVSGYSVSVKNTENGFIITGISNEPVLSATNDENVVSANETATENNDSNGTNTSNNSTGNEETNTTEDTTDNSTDKNTSDETSKDTNDTTPSKTKETTKKTDKTTPDKKTNKNKAAQKDKTAKKNNTNKTTMKKAGLPIALVLVAMAGIFIPIARRKE